jgi:hypothetical protein
MKHCVIFAVAFLDKNFDESDENMCENCFKMKDHLEVLINECPVNKILQEKVKSTSTGPGNQDDLTNCVQYKSYKEYHATKRKDSAWKEI